MKNLFHNCLVGFTIFFAVIIMMDGCEKRDSLYGTENQIVVIADEADWAKVDTTVRDVFEIEFFTPQPERVFTLKTIASDEIQNFTRWRNICIIATLQTGGEVGKIVKSVLSKRDRQRVQNDSSYVFRKKDAWSRGQLVLVIVAKDIPTLLNRIKAKQDILFNLFDQHASELAAANLGQSQETKNLSQSLLKEFGWTMTIQRDYFLAQKSIDDHFVWIRRLNPHRWIFVHWLDTDDPSLLSEEWLVNTRNEIAATHYKGDVIVDDFTKTQVVEFLNRYAIRIDGHWENREMNVGGAFRSYGFYDQNTSRLYMIDLAVHAPGQRKLPYLRQLDTMIHTFKTAAES